MLSDVDVEPLEVIPPIGHHRLKAVPPDMLPWQSLLATQGIFTMSCECGLMLAAPDMVNIAHMWQRHIRHVVSLTTAHNQE